MPSSLICVDASLVVRTVVDTADSRLPTLWHEWTSAGRQAIAPALLYFEVTNALYQYQRLDLLTPETINQALNTAVSLPIRLHAHAGLHLAALKMAQRFQLRATYDAHYLALAAQNEAEFWTADQHLCRVVQPNLPWVYTI